MGAAGFADASYGMGSGEVGGGGIEVTDEGE